MNCLMIQTYDNRKLFTHEENLPMLAEFTKTFQAEISIVKILDNNTEILELKKLAPAFCNSNYTSNHKVKIIKKLPPDQRLTRKLIIKQAEDIQKFIREKLKNMEPISLKEIKNKYKKLNISDSCLCNHLYKVRKELEEKGYSIKKTGIGKYQLEA